MNIKLMESSARLAAQSKKIEASREVAMQAAMESLVGYDKARAELFWEKCGGLTELHATARDLSLSLSGATGNIYVASRSFLSALVRTLTTSEKEEIAHVTGPHFGNVRLMAEVHKLNMSVQTHVHAQADVKSCADAEIKILEAGNILSCCAHSHPGKGIHSTHPSSTDLDYLERIQRVGSETVGAIVTRDGWIRFFSVLTQFQVLITGSGVKQENEHVFQIALS